MVAGSSASTDKSSGVLIVSNVQLMCAKCRCFVLIPTLERSKTVPRTPLARAVGAGRTFSDDRANPARGRDIRDMAVTLSL